MASVTQSIPDKKALLVEYPGFVRNSDAAIQTLGGLDAISAITDGSSQMLSLYFRPGDPLSHPLLGYKQHTQGLLLRITRKTGQAGAASDAEEELKAEVVAHVKSVVRFPGMADFQYVSCDPRPLQEQVPQQEGPPGLEAEPMQFPPPLFSKQDLPLDYAFRSFYSGDPDYMKAGASLGRGIGRLAAHVINFQAVNVLPPLSDSGAEEAGLYKDRKVVLRDFAMLLAERPIWSSAALKERVTGFTDMEFDIMLPRVAYMFRNGPWRGLWVRRGYDPRSDHTSHKYQAIEYRGVERSAAQAAAASAGPSYKEVSSFAALPVGDCTLQLCDLSDDYIQGAVDKVAQLDSCSIKSGWFSAEVWHELRGRLEARFAALHHAAASSRGLAGLTGAILTAPSHTAQQPELTATSRQDQAGGLSSATEPPHPSASVLDSWLADGPPPIAPSAAQLLAASGVDQGDFEIYEGSDMEEQDAAGIADDKIGLGEDAQTNDEAEEDSDESDNEGQAQSDEEGAEGDFANGETEEEEEDSEEADEEDESEMHDEDLEEAYNEDDELG
ncbi:hypothetical protein WJX75_001425 [Coccomyxa subellipsoidea]|uniref:Transcription factor IIIC subunit 5 HTH domain-containing protein n=1 Tax=Coccomyxa subellipsoidea TaxID=248742 RepID=A0ABR2YZ08_9CHLO